jgi:hypothetical protein
MSDQRYQPLPSLDQLPAWLWRRTGTRARVVTAGALLLTIAMAVVLIPAARQAQHESAAAESAQRADRRAQAIRALQAEQRPRHGRVDAAASRLVAPAGRPVPGAEDTVRRARAAALGDVEAAIAADARTRGFTILRSSCEPFPKTVGAQPLRPRGSFACVAVTAEIARTERNAAGVLGEPYRAAIDFTTGRYAFCKIAGRPDPVPDPKVVTPKECSI